MSAVLHATETVHVVLDSEARVVAMFWGADSPAEAAEWADRGYRVESVDSSLIS